MDHIMSNNVLPLRYFDHTKRDQIWWWWLLYVCFLHRNPTNPIHTGQPTFGMFWKCPDGDEQQFQSIWQISGADFLRGRTNQGRLVIIIVICGGFWAMSYLSFCWTNVLISSPKDFIPDGSTESFCSQIFWVDAFFSAVSSYWTGIWHFCKKQWYF